MHKVIKIFAHNERVSIIRRRILQLKFEFKLMFQIGENTLQKKELANLRAPANERPSVEVVPKLSMSEYQSQIYVQLQMLEIVIEGHNKPKLVRFLWKDFHDIFLLEEMKQLDEIGFRYYFSLFQLGRFTRTSKYRSLQTLDMIRYQ